MADMHEYLVVKKGKTSKTMPVFIKDSAVTTGAGKTGLLFNTGTPKWYYWREDTGNANGVSVTLATMTRGTWASGGFIEIDATNLPGWYQVGVPNAALATGSEWCLMELSGFTGGAALTFLIQLLDYDPQDTVRLGLTALPNVAAQSAGGLPTVGTGASQVDVDGSGRVNVGKWLGSVPNALISGQIQSLGGVTRNGTAQAGAASTITLDAGASATDNIYNDQMVVILSATGVGQARLITGYVGSTKVATISPSWQTNPDATSVFAILPDTQIRLVSGQLTVKKNTVLAAFMFLMVDSADGRTPKTGLTVTGQRAIDGGAFGACTNSGTIAEIANGWYKIDLSAADLNGNNIALRFTATGADATNLELLAQA